MESIEDSGGLVHLLSDRERSARHDDQYDRFAGSGKRVHHLRLRARQIEVRAATRLAGEDRFLAAEEEDDVRFLSRLDGFGYTGGALIAAVSQTGDKGN